MTPRFGRYASLSRARPDLPAWLDAVLAKAVDVDPGATLRRRHRICPTNWTWASIWRSRFPRRAARSTSAIPCGFWQAIRPAALAVAVLALAARLAAGARCGEGRSGLAAHRRSAC